MNIVIGKTAEPTPGATDEIVIQFTDGSIQRINPPPGHKVDLGGLASHFEGVGTYYLVRDPR